MYDIIKAELSDLDIVKRISAATISEIYPRYYPKGAVDFFLKHHSESNIIDDIKQNHVFLCCENENIVGTVTIKGNEICRLFVLPEFQGKGYGGALLDFSEKNIFEKYSDIILDASLPAKGIYIKRGYKETEYKIIKTHCDDFLCYDIMVKHL
ncbi:MAG: GNAT family N-acetyltransferase [Oscillospiraceae bacterium]|nr:GNAT family N-acetyltransferase [Oscillospiraceae bacterium]